MSPRESSYTSDDGRSAWTDEPSRPGIIAVPLVPYRTRKSSDSLAPGRHAPYTRGSRISANATTTVASYANMTAQEQQESDFRTLDEDIGDVNAGKDEELLEKARREGASEGEIDRLAKAAEFWRNVDKDDEEPGELNRDDKECGKKDRNDKEIPTITVSQHA